MMSRKEWIRREKYLADLEAPIRSRVGTLSAIIKVVSDAWYAPMLRCVVGNVKVDVFFINDVIEVQALDGKANVAMLFCRRSKRDIIEHIAEQLLVSSL
jgi:hypothetical protein